MNKNKPTIRIKLVHKLIISYTLIIFFISAAIVSSITGLFSQNKVARDVAKSDIVITKTIHKLGESIQAQERNAGKYIILRRPEFEKIFEQRAAEFNKYILELAKTGQYLELRPLQNSHESFLLVVEQIFKGKNESLQQLRKKAEDVTDAINTLFNNHESLLKTKLEIADKAQSSTITWTIVLAFTGLIVAIITAAILTYNLLSSINKLKKATMSIAEGNFDYDHQIPEQDEIGELAKDFSAMALRLKAFEQIWLDANPLTRLPGNLAIERIIDARLISRLPFAVCYADLDNFKAYNDRYGYIKASEVIRITGEIINESVKELAGNDGFAGHIGGDDFVAVVTPDKAPMICDYIIKKFSDMIPSHYSIKDVERGAIVGLDRYGVKRIFPLMTISIAVIVCENSEYKSAVEVAMAAAQLKDFVKGSSGSNYFISRYMESGVKTFDIAGQ